MRTKHGPLMVYGIRPVLEALSSEPCPINKLFVCRDKRGGGLSKILEESRKIGLALEETDKKGLNKRFGALDHQGVVGLGPEFQFTPIEILIKKGFQSTGSPVVTILDGITDPGNFGGVARSAEAMGIQGIIISKDRSSPVSATVFKRSAGAVSHLPIARVTNIGRAVELLKKKGFWVVGADVSAETRSWDFDFDGPTAVVLGSEAKGMRGMVARMCDFKVAIPMSGKTGSLNVASAASVIFYEILRQRGLNVSNNGKGHQEVFKGHF